MRHLLAILLVMLSVAAMGCEPSDGGFRSVSAAEFSQIIQDTSKAQVLDVRTAQEYATGHIPGAISADVNSADFEGAATAALHKGKTVAVYCRSGRRSKIAARMLSEKGYTVVELDCGISCWISAGKEVTLK